MRRIHASVVLVVLACASYGVTMADTPVTNWDLQAVDPNGHASNPLVGGDTRVIVEGICLNNPEDMLSPASQWQVFVQGAGGDNGGTAAWTGSFFYDPNTWASELARINSSGFRQGDSIRITGFANDTSGKSNINERHSGDPAMDFSVELLGTGVGLPAPLVTTIADMNTFDSSRMTGGESYQCRRIELDHVTLQPGTATWGSNKVLTIVDPNDPSQTLPLRLCNVAFGPKPNTWFNIVGLGDQESSYTSGYQVWVTQASGIEVPGDCNLDGKVNGADYLTLAGNWLQDFGAPSWAKGDFDGNGVVDSLDRGLLAANFAGISGDTNGDGVVDVLDLNNVYNNLGLLGCPVGDTDFDGNVDVVDLNNVYNNLGVAQAVGGEVPEPATVTLLAVGGVAMIRRKSRR